MAIRYEPVLKGIVKVVNNDVVPKDWERNSDDIFNSVIKDIRNGSIVLLHDGSEDELELEERPREMVKALPRIISALKTRHEIVRLDELIR